MDRKDRKTSGSGARKRSSSPRLRDDIDAKRPKSSSPPDSPQWVDGSSSPKMPKGKEIEELKKQLKEKEAALLQEAKFINDLQSRCVCVICHDLMFEPYAFACGHTYCYSCIVEWLQHLRSRRERTCPECRALVTTQPIPSYVARRVIDGFVKREMLRNTESELEKQQKEAQSTVEKDKASAGRTNGGLFRGLFDRKLGMLDLSDGVLRCPSCNWEVHGLHCENCHTRIDGVREADGDFSDESESEGDSIFSDEEEQEDGMFVPYSIEAPQRWADDILTADDRDISLDDEDMDGYGTEEEGDREQRLLDQRSGEQLHYMQARMTRRRSLSVDSWTGRRSSSTSGLGRRHASIVVEDEDDSELESSAQPPRSQRRRHVSSDSETETEDDDDDDSLAGFIVSDSSEANPTSDHTWDGSSPAIQSDPPVLRRRNVRPVVLDEEDEDETNVSEASSRPFRLRRRPVICDYDDEESALIDSGYRALHNQTASEADETDDHVSSSLRRPGRRQRAVNRRNSVASVPEEDESEAFWEDGNSEDETADDDRHLHVADSMVPLSPVLAPRFRRWRNRLVPTIDLEITTDEESDGERGTRRLNENRVHGHANPRHRLNRGRNDSHRLSEQINPSIADLFASHRPRVEDAFDFLARRGNSQSPNADRSATPVQRIRTPLRRTWTPRLGAQDGGTGGSSIGEVLSRAPSRQVMSRRDEFTSLDGAVLSASHQHASFSPQTIPATSSPIHPSPNRSSNVLAHHFQTLPQQVGASPRPRNGLRPPPSPGYGLSVGGASGREVRRVGSRTSRNHLRTAIGTNGNVYTVGASSGIPSLSNVAGSVENTANPTSSISALLQNNPTIAGSSSTSIVGTDANVANRSTAAAVNPRLRPTTGRIRQITPEDVFEMGSASRRARQEQRLASGGNGGNARRTETEGGPGRRLAAMNGEGDGGAMLVIGREE